MILTRLSSLKKYIHTCGIPPFRFEAKAITRSSWGISTKLMVGVIVGVITVSAVPDTVPVIVTAPVDDGSVSDASGVGVLVGGARVGVLEGITTGGSVSVGSGSSEGSGVERSATVTSVGVAVTGAAEKNGNCPL